MKKFFLFFIGIVFNLSSWAKGDLQEANMLYQKGDYENAAKLYENIIKAGLEAPELYYNLGNSYFKLNNVSASILNYERAQKLAPGDNDIDFNLKMANLKVVDKITPIPQIFYKKWLNDIRDVFSADSWASFTIVLIWISVVLMILFVLSRLAHNKRIFFYLSSVCLVLFLLSWFFASQQQSELNSADKAIVFEPSVYVKSSPNDNSVDLFILHEGTKVELLDEIGNWKRIRLANGNEGWLQANTIQVI